MTGSPEKGLSLHVPGPFIVVLVTIVFVDGHGHPWPRGSRGRIIMPERRKTGSHTLGYYYSAPK